MKQYFAIKARHPGTVLLFRMGDFYETFDEDARLVHDVLGITLTKRSNGQAADVPLAGFPHHAIDNYLPKLVRAGLRVAICEQLEDPKKAKSIVKRDVVEIVTPGVSFRDQLLEPKQSQFIAAVHREVGPRASDIVGVAFADASTGEFSVAEVATGDLAAVLQTVSPAEVLLESSKKNELDAVRNVEFLITGLDDWVFKSEYARDLLTTHFGTHSLKGFGVDDLEVGMVAAGAILHYLQETQKARVTHLQPISRFDTSDFMLLDEQTRRNLELVSSLNQGTRDGTLIQILDHTKTAMGGRLLRSWLLRPLRSMDAIHHRQSAVEALFKKKKLLEKFQDLLIPVGDLERIAAKIAVRRVSPRDLIYLRDTLRLIPSIQTGLKNSSEKVLSDLGNRLILLDELVAHIESTIVDEPPPTLKDGGVIRTGFHTQLDELRELSSSGKEWLTKLQKNESERTGISSLKIGFNRVFGYYLEVTNTHKDRVPENWIRKQTLVNAERYITEELKQYEERILGAEDEIKSLEAELFEEIVSKTSVFIPDLQVNGHLLATLDVFASFAEAARRNNYVRPDVDQSTELHIQAGRHPVVEQVLPVGESFIPNDVRLDSESNQILIITGPNMAGKSVVLRQVGLIVLMAQVGSFVPAKSATVGIVDRIFTRVGASDNLAAGESTFLVEMNETANILNSASPSSLILLDEVGRGTSTFDGLSIAWALVEFLHDEEQVAARTLFATHYHELNELADRLVRVQNFNIQVQEHDGRIIFLRKLVEGGADHSYGIEVARMAGLPESVLRRAHAILRHLESQQLEVEEIMDEVREESGYIGPRRPIPESSSSQMSLFTDLTDPVAAEIKERIESLDLDQLTPIDALVALADLKKMTRDRSL
ncbi:MAG: DNA mismatch repair protein MutS [Bacteroidetes bacterium]|nr:MAG: DNA mismatch repair protein MutS [Bacteroidota bacterium]